MQFAIMLNIAFVVVIRHRLKAVFLIYCVCFTDLSATLTVIYTVYRMTVCKPCLKPFIDFRSYMSVCVFLGERASEKMYVQLVFNRGAAILLLRRPLVMLVLLVYTKTKESWHIAAAVMHTVCRHLATQPLLASIPTMLALPSTSTVTTCAASMKAKQRDGHFLELPQKRLYVRMQMNQANVASNIVRNVFPCQPPSQISGECPSESMWEYSRKVFGESPAKRVGTSMTVNCKLCSSYVKCKLTYEFTKCPDTTLRTFNGN